MVSVIHHRPRYLLHLNPLGDVDDGNEGESHNVGADTPLYLFEFMLAFVISVFHH